MKERINQLEGKVEQMKILMDSVRNHRDLLMKRNEKLTKVYFTEQKKWRKGEKVWINIQK